MGKYFGLRGNALNLAIALIAGCDFLYASTGSLSMFTDTSTGYSATTKESQAGF